jgi:hypothetical protein
MNSRLLTILILFFSLFLTSCEEDKDLFTPELKLIQKVKGTELLLRENKWGFNDLVVNVKYEMRAIPLLANVADGDGMVQPGKYNSLDIFGNNNRQLYYNYEFTYTRINRDTSGTGIFQKLGYYNIINKTEIRVNQDSLGSATYVYKYLDKEGIFKMTSDHLTNGKINEAVNRMITNAISSGKPGDISNAVVDKILGNEELQAAIQQLLYDLIYGKIDEIAQNPQEIAQKLASLIIDKLKEVDWESLVYDKLVELLEELKVDNPEQKARELAAQISAKIETSISQQDIYNAILPILQKFENETLPKLVPAISDAIYKAITKVFSEENIYNKIYPIWIRFSEVDSIKIGAVADTLGTVITNYFFNADSMAPLLEPFIVKLRSTPTTKIPALAQEIIDTQLKPPVDSINANFPGLELNPDWNSVKTILTSALTAIKSSISDKTDAEAAADMAGTIISIMDLIITKGVESAILYLQDIPAEQASQVIAAWINNLVVMAEPEIVAFLEGKLTGLADMFSAEDTAEEISTKIHNKILEKFSAENIYNLILPLMQRLSEMNVEAAAGKIADWLTDLDFIKDNVSEEQVLDALTEIISGLIGNINVDQITQKLVDLILQSNIIQNIDGKVLKQLLEIKTYEFLIELGKEINAIDNIEVSIVIK